MKWRVWTDWEPNSALLIVDASDAAAAAQKYAKEKRLRVGSAIRVTPLNELRTFKVGVQEVVPS